MEERIDFIRNRITELRMQKDVSEYKMSRALGHSKGYIQGISSGRSLPSLPEFLDICDYLGVSPKEFFDPQVKLSDPIIRVTDYMVRMNESDTELLVSFAEILSKRTPR
ncbi:MAG: helix-turn-helix domain-containing protein [Lachnospiraceae bacterium]|nr:helix-turn-helix domain-containing protein [Lachnospiraceae bacterium]